MMMRSRLNQTIYFCLAALLALVAITYFPLAGTHAANVSATILPSAGKPLVNLKNPQSLKFTYTGDSGAVAALQNGTAIPTALASADFDADGAVDVVAGYSTGNGGAVVLFRGNQDAYAPQDATLYQKALKGSVPATFQSKAAAFAVPESPDLLATGDFNRDGYKDVLAAAHGGTTLYLLAGDGTGHFHPPQAIALTGQVSALAESEDGHVAISMNSSNGSELAIFDPSTEGFSAGATFKLPASASSIAWGSLGAGSDIAVAAGSNIFVVYGALSAKPQTETINLPFEARALALGDFIWDQDARTEISVLADDGSIQILQHGTLNTAPLSAAQIPARRKAYSSRTHQAPNPTALGAWTVAKQLPYTGSAPSGSVSRSAFSSPHVAASSTHDVMVLDAGSSQLNILDTSGKTASPSAAVSFSSIPVAALALPQKINAARDVVVLTSSQSAPTLITVPANLTFNVTTTADEDDAGSCSTTSTVKSGTGGDGVLSLREAVCEANNNGSSTSTINVPGGTYSLTISTFGGNGSASSSAELQVGIQSGNNITISGAGAGSTIIQQTNGHDRVIEADELLNGNQPLAIQNVTIQNGTCTDSGLDCDLGGGGGAILAGGPGDPLTLTNVTLSHNSANSTTEGFSGGALYYSGTTLTITGSTISLNSVGGSGIAGGVFAEDADIGGYLPGSLTITNSTFSGNTATDNTGTAKGGGLYFQTHGGYAGTITGSTFTGNTATSTGSLGGAIYAETADTSNGLSSITISNSRIVGNIASQSTGFEDDEMNSTITNNWWGCNGGPGASGCDTVIFGAGTSSFTPYLVLGISANPTQILPNGTSTLTADLTHNSASTGGFSVPNGTPVTFGGTLDSSVNPTNTTLTSGQATSTYTAGNTPGTGSGTATVDNQAVSVTINIKANTSTTVAVEDAATSSPWSGTEVAGASAYANSTVSPVGSSGGPTPTGTVTYTIFSSGTCSGPPLGNSVVSLVSGAVPKSSTFGPLATGTYSFEAAYSGDNDYNSSSSSCASFSVNKAAPSTSVGSSVNPSTFGQPVTFTATLNGAYLPTGTVNFTSNSTTISGCSAVSVSAGTAQCTTSTLPVGTDTIVATYSGDGNNTGSTGTLAGGQQVNPVAAPTTTSVSSNNNPSFTAAPGNSVTFTATVTSNTTVNEGTVTFSDPANDFTCSGGNTVPVSNGQASCTTSFSTEGSRNVTAAYNGTVNFQASSGFITQTVNNHTVVTGNQFCNQGAITIPSTAGAATPYPSNIFVTGLSGNVGAVTVNLNNISSSDIAQTDLLLVGPTGAAIIPFAKVGDGSTIGGVNITLDDSASSSIPGGSPLTSGTYKPTSITGSTSLVFPAPAPTVNASNYAATDGTATLSSMFSGTAPNGTWALYAMDNSGSGAATIGGGWCVNISPATVAVTITTSPSGLLVSADGGTPTAAPLVENWVIGSSHTIATTSPQSGGAGVQYVWSSWSDSGAISHSITVPSSPTTYTASFNTQYQLTTQASPSADGTVTPASGSYFASGATIPVTATANAGFTFSNWTSTGGSFDSTTAASTNFHMPAAPATVTGNFTTAAQPQVTLNPTSVNFGNVYLYTMVSQEITVQNTGNAPLIFTSITLTGKNGGGMFRVQNSCPKTLAVGHTCQVEVFFNANQIGPRTNTLSFFDNAPGSPQQVGFTAMVINPIASFNPNDNELEFGTVKQGHSKSMNVTITNIGTTQLTITSVGITGSDISDFSDRTNCTSLAPNRSCIVSVTFTPTTTGDRSANLTVMDNAQMGTTNISLTGTGD
jgi:hypothetical protein